MVKALYMRKMLRVRLGEYSGLMRSGASWGTSRDMVREVVAFKGLVEPCGLSKAEKFRDVDDCDRDDRITQRKDAFLYIIKAR